MNIQLTANKLQRFSFLGVATVVILADYLVSLVDCVVAGRVLGESELGAMCYLMPVFSVVMFGIWLVASGYSGLFARLQRRGDTAGALQVVRDGVCAALLTGGTLVALMCLFETPYLAFMDPDVLTRNLASDYFDFYPAVILLQAVLLMGLYLLCAAGRKLLCINLYFVLLLTKIILSEFLATKWGMRGLSAGSIGADVVTLVAGLVVLGPQKVFVRFRPHLTLMSLVRIIRGSFGHSAILLFHAVLFVALTKYVIGAWGSESLPVLAVVFCIIRLTLFFGSAGVAVELSPLRTTDLRRMMHVLFSAQIALAVLFVFEPELLVGLFGLVDPELVEGAKEAARLTVGGVALSAALAYFCFRRKVKASGMREAPLNYLQQYAFGRLMEDPDAQLFNLAMLFKLRADIDPTKLAAALVTSARAHAALRTVLRRDPTGTVVQREELPLEAITCPIVKAEAEEVLANKRTLACDFKPFGMRLYDAKIFDCGTSAYLLSNFHHLICDGYSFPLLLEDARKVYHGEPIEAGDYYGVLARRAERAETPPAVAARLGLRALLSEERFVTLPTPDKTDLPGYGTCEVDLTLPANFADFLTARRVTRHHVFLAATLMALRATTDANDLLIDWVFHGRVSREEMKTVGPFMVDLPLVAENVAELTSSDILSLVKQATFRGIRAAGAFRSVEDLNPTGRARLTFNHHDEWSELMSAGAINPQGPYGWMFEEAIPLVSANARAENPFNVEIFERQESTRLFLEYDAGRYSPELARRFADSYRHALVELLGN